MNRIDRLTAILIQLQTKKIVKAEEIADRFEISKRTVYRDIRALEEAGIPIGSEAGIGYFITDGFHLPPVMFTREEAGAMLIASKLVEKMTDNSIEKTYNSALYKIKSVLKSSEKDYLEEIDKSINVFNYYQENDTEYPNDFTISILQAISLSKEIEISYCSYSKKEVTKRQIKPYWLCNYSMNWHLIGFCKLRKDYRDFRIDRIKNVKILEKSFEKPKDETIIDYFEKNSRTDDLISVKLKFDKTTAYYIKNTKLYFGFIYEEEENEHIIMNFVVNSLEYIGSWILSFGKNVEILSPEKLQDIVVQNVENLSEIYLKK